MRLKIKAKFKLRADGMLTPQEVAALKEAFEDGTVAEALDFILDRYVDLNELYPICQTIAETESFWETTTLKALTIKLFYDMVNKIPKLDVNSDLDLSVTYWVNQAMPIMDKVLADSTELRS